MEDTFVGSFGGSSCGSSCAGQLLRLLHFTWRLLVRGNSTKTDSQAREAKDFGVWQSFRMTASSPHWGAINVSLPCRRDRFRSMASSNGSWCLDKCELITLLALSTMRALNWFPRISIAVLFAVSLRLWPSSMYCCVDGVAFNYSSKPWMQYGVTFIINPSVRAAHGFFYDLLFRDQGTMRFLDAKSSRMP